MATRGNTQWAKVGTGHLTPFKYTDPGSESLVSSSNWGARSGFLDHVKQQRNIHENVTELTPFKVGPETPGDAHRHLNNVPAFHERNPGVPTFPPFSKRMMEQPKDTP